MAQLTDQIKQQRAQNKPQHVSQFGVAYWSINARDPKNPGILGTSINFDQLSVGVGLDALREEAQEE